MLDRLEVTSNEVEVSPRVFFFSNATHEGTISRVIRAAAERDPTVSITIRTKVVVNLSMINVKFTGALNKTQNDCKTLVSVVLSQSDSLIKTVSIHL